MKLGIATVFLISVKLSLAGEAPAPLHLPYATPVDGSISSWTRLAVIGDTDSTPPMIWFSDQDFDRERREYLIHLSTIEYRHLSDFIRTSRCTITDDMYEHAARGTLLITQFQDQKTIDLCVLPPDTTCAFLKSVARFDRVLWTEERLAPILLLKFGLCDQ